MAVSTDSFLCYWKNGFAAVTCCTLKVTVNRTLINQVWQPHRESMITKPDALKWVNSGGEQQRSRSGTGRSQTWRNLLCGSLDLWRSTSQRQVQNSGLIVKIMILKAENNMLWQPGPAHPWIQLRWLPLSNHRHGPWMGDRTGWGIEMLKR